MHSFVYGLPQVPASQFLRRNKPIRRMHIDFGEKPKQSFGDVEPVLVVDEVFPLGMGIGGGGMLERMLLPFVVLAAELDVGDERVEGDVVVVLLAVEGGIEGEIGAEAEAAVAVAGASCWSVGN